jgi:hypothetical protein
MQALKNVCENPPENFTIGADVCPGMRRVSPALFTTDVTEAEGQPRPWLLS